MCEYNDFRYTCLFGGGAIRGAAHVGVIRALKELNIIPSVLGGSSVGSIIAALYAVGYTPDELAEIFLSVNFELFRDISLGINNKFALSKGNVFLEWLRDLIERKYYGAAYLKGQCKKVTFRDIKKDLVIITTNMKNFKCREFSTFETPDFEIALAVRISCCMPGLMGAVALDDELLVDGDLMKGKPMWMLSDNLKNSKDRILEIRLEGSFSGSDKKPLEYVNGMYSCMTFNETEFIKKMYGNRDRFDYLVINTGNVVVVDFNYPIDKRQAIIDNGYNQTMKYFTDTLPLKKKTLDDIYVNIMDIIRKVQGFMLRKKYFAAKNCMQELFIYLFDKKDIIDPELLDILISFQKLLSSNVSTGLLGRSKCSNLPTVNNVLGNLIKNLSLRIDALEKYIDKFIV